MPTLQWGAHPWHWFLLWGLASFGVSLLYGSFFEWSVHKFVMHRRQRWLPFPYELHAVSHHGLFGADETYHAQDDNMRAHVDFVLRDYVLILLFNLPFALGAELLCGRPLVIGWFLATLAYLQVFNSLHSRWHVPSDTWLQRTRLFQWMKNRHRVHHGNPTKNLNLILPIADFCFGTMK